MPARRLFSCSVPAQRPGSNRYRSIVSLLLLTVAPVGCSQAQSEDRSDDAAVSKTPLRESWDALYLQGAKVGHAHTTVSEVSEDGRKLQRHAGELKMKLTRFGQKIEQSIQFATLETSEGQVRSFTSRARLGPVPIAATGRLGGDGGTEMVIDMTTQGKTQQVKIPWSREYGGFFAVEESLVAEPMRPGQERTIRSLAPVLNQITVTELSARDWESTELLEGQKKLLRINTVMTIPGGGALESTLWTDRSGATLKSEVAAMKQVTYRTTKEIATAPAEGGKLDIGLDSSVRIARPLRDPHAATVIRYRVTLDGDDPAKILPAGPSQQIRSLDKQSAEVTVRAVRPRKRGGDVDADDKPPQDKPTDDDRRPNNMIQSDDARVVALAGKIAPDEKDHWTLAVALEKGVRQSITMKNFSQAFATAAEVAESLEGDCTEHAVLLAALLRAREIPARVAMGLVYMPSQQAFGYHMWTEAWIDGGWIPLDATLGRGGIGAGHIQVAHSNLKGSSALGSFLPVAKVLGRLKIEVLAEE